MALPRNSIPDFEVANAAYALSEVTVFIANADGSKGVLATLYSSLTGLGTLPNPQTLDNTGKWQQPVYIDSDVILQINSPLDDNLDGDTGIVRSGGRWRGVWTGPGTHYNIDDLIVGPIGQPEESNVYRSQSIWDSTGTWATDVADATKLVLELDYQALVALALSAVPDAAEGVKGKIAIATQATTNTGTNDTEAVTPLKLATMQATETQKGVAAVATQTEVNNGSSDAEMVTPAKLNARVASETLQGIIAIATQAEVDGGSNNTEAVTPQKLKIFVDASVAAGAFGGTLTSTDAGAAEGPDFISYRASPSPAANDILGAYNIAGHDSAGNFVTYAQFLGQILDPADGSEDGRGRLRASTAGTLIDTMLFGPGIQVGAPTGGDKGVGTLNAQNGLYAAGIQIVPNEIAIFQDQKANNTVGGTPTASAWTKHTLQTTVVNAATGVSLTSSVIALPSGGKWTVRAWMVCYNPTTSGFQTRLQNTTDAVAISGLSKASNIDGINEAVEVSGYINCSGGAKNVELQYFTGAATANGLGVAAAPGTNVEVYAEVEVRRVG